MDEYIKMLYFSDLELDNCFEETPEQRKIASKMAKLEDELSEQLKDDELKLFEKYLSARNDYLKSIGEYNFVVGFKFGSRLMIETLN